MRVTVSVLIPTYNYARYLPEALDSVLDQSFRDFELLIVDDASTDGTREIIESYAARDPRVRVHLQPKNVGMVANWNAALKLASGELIKPLFGDDKLCSRDALAKMVEPMMAHPQVSLVMSGRRRLDAESREGHRLQFAGQEGLSDGRRMILRSLEVTRNLLGEPSAALFRRQYADRGFDPSYRQLVDLEFWFHLLEQGDFFYVPEPLCGFRVHDSQQTAVNRAGQVDAAEYLRLLETYWNKPFVRQGAGQTFLFNNIYSLSKSRGNSAPSGLELELRSRLGKTGFLLQWLRYRISRPVDNLCQSIRKRTG